MRAIHLKVPGNTYDGYNVYQNNNTFGKIFQLGIKKEKLTNEFVKNYLTECNKQFSYSHYNIGINVDFVINELSFQLDNIFDRIIKIMKNGHYGKTFPKYIDSISSIFPFIKDNILGIYKNSIYLQSYWGYHTPNDLFGRLNNDDVGKIIGKQYQGFIDKIKSENQESRIFQNEKIIFKDNLVPIFPGERGQSEVSEGSIPVKYIDDKAKEKLEEISDSIYEYFIDNDMEEFVESMKLFVENKNTNMFQEMINGKTDEKDIFIRFFLLYQSKFENFVYDTFFKKSCIFGLDYYLYENQYFLDLSDIVFVGSFEERTRGNYVLKNKGSLEMLKDMLIDGLKDGYYDHYVMKLTYNFDQENGENYVIEHVRENLFKINDGAISNYIELDDEEQELLKDLGSVGRKKIRWGITLGLYSTKLEKLQEFKKIVSTNMKNSGYQIYFKNVGENIFEHNNYLFQTTPLKKTTNLTFALNVKRFFELMPGITQNDEDGIYLGTDWYSKQPIIKQPYSKQQTEGRNIICVGSTGSGKTMFMQQMICGNFKDKFFIIDPTGTFANLKNLTDDIIVKKIFDLDYNPIAINKEFYEKFGVNWRIAKKSKVELVVLLLGIDQLQVSDDFKITLKLIIDYIYDAYDEITIETINNFLLDIFKNGKYPEFLNDALGGNLEMTKQVRDDFGKIIRVIRELKSHGPIYDFLTKKEDMTKLFSENSKIVLDITELGFTDRGHLEHRDQIVFLYLLQNILSYLTFNRNYLGNNKKELGGGNAFPKHYIIIDEIHLMFKIPSLRKLYINILRTIRNKYGQITGLSQTISDFAFSMDDGGTGSELDVINQNHIKFFFQENDLRSYIQILEKANGAKKKDKNGEGSDDEPLKLKQLKFYANEFAQIKKERLEENGGKGPRLMLTEYYGEYFLCSPQLSKLFLDNLHLLN